MARPEIRWNLLGDAAKTRYLTRATDILKEQGKPFTAEDVLKLIPKANEIRLTPYGGILMSIGQQLKKLGFVRTEGGVRSSKRGPLSLWVWPHPPEVEPSPQADQDERDILALADKLGDNLLPKPLPNPIYKQEVDHFEKWLEQEADDEMSHRTSVLTILRVYQAMKKIQHG